MVIKVRGGYPDIVSVVNIGDSYFSSLGLMFVVVDVDPSTGEKQNFGIPLLNEEGVNYMLRNRDKLMNEGVISAIYQGGMLVRIISNPCSVVFPESCGEDESTISYLFGGNKGLVEYFLASTEKEGKIDFAKFEAIGDDEIAERFREVKSLYVKFIRRVLSWNDSKISIANYIGQIGGMISKGEAVGRKIAGTGLVVSDEENVGVAEEDGFEPGVEMDGDEGVLKNEKSGESKFNRGGLKTMQGYYDVLDKNVRDWYKKKRGFFFPFLKKYSLNGNNKINVDEFVLNNYKMALKFIKKTFFTERILRKNKNIFEKNAGTVQEEENLKLSLLNKFKEKIDYDGFVKEKVKEIFQDALWNSYRRMRRRNWRNKVYPK